MEIDFQHEMNVKINAEMSRVSFTRSLKIGTNTEFKFLTDEF